jgi:hypothetical protein
MNGSDAWVWMLICEGCIGFKRCCERPARRVIQ